MSKRAKAIHIDTVTREFIKFAKIMGIFPNICKLFFNAVKETNTHYYFLKPDKDATTDISKYFMKGSFYEYALDKGTYFCLLNDGLIKRVYLFEYYDSKSFENSDILADLFLSHLKDKGYIRYIKLIH
jgi:hypothetical protein